MGLFDNVKDDHNEAKVIERLESLDINIDNLSVSIEDGITYISGTVDSDDDLAAIEEEFEGGLLSGATVELDIDVVQYYTIEDGDSPWGVAQKFWGDGNKYPILVEMNDGKDTYYTGDEIMIPSLRSYVGGAKLQVILSALGYEVGTIDGVLGARTIAALKEFQKNTDLTANGKLDDDTRSALRAAFRNEVEDLQGAELQFVLNEVGYNVGAVDGVVGSKTISALKKFQNDNDLDDSGEVDEDTLAALASYFV
jgi:hypothetical protein